MGIVYYHHYQPKVESDILEINRTDDNFRPDNIKYDTELINFTVDSVPPKFDYSENDHYADRIFLSKDERSAFYVAIIGYERSWLERIVQGRRINRYIIHFVFEGSGFFNSMPISRGQAFICLPNEKYSLINNPKDPMRHGWISVNGYDLENQIKLLSLPTAPIINVKDINRVEKLIKNTVYCPCNNLSAENVQNLLLSRLFRVISLLDTETAANDTSNNAHTRYIGIVNDYINTHYHYNITVMDLAQHAGVSVSYLRQIFTTHLGMSPQEAIIEKKMSVAKKMLTETNMPISAIASGCGYSDQSAFCKVFKKTQNVSPLQYRKKVKNTD